MLALIFHFRKILSLLLTVLLSLWLFNRGPDERFRIARGLQATLLSPAQYVINKLNNVRDLLRENEELRTSLMVARTENDLLREMRQENGRLRAMLDYRAQSVFSLIAAEVIAHRSDFLSKNLMITAGSAKGVKKDMPVIGITGVLGKVIESYPFHSNVQLINDPYARTGVLFSRINVPAVLEYLNDVTPAVRLPAHHKIEAGDTVRTSGLGGIYPKGLTVGRVRRVVPENDQYNLIHVELHPGLTHVEHVFVLNISSRWQAFEEAVKP